MKINIVKYRDTKKFKRYAALIWSLFQLVFTTYQLCRPSLSDNQTDALNHYTQVIFSTKYGKFMGPPKNTHGYHMILNIFQNKGQRSCDNKHLLSDMFYCIQVPIEYSIKCRNASFFCME